MLPTAVLKKRSGSSRKQTPYLWYAGVSAPGPASRNAAAILWTNRLPLRRSSGLQPISTWKKDIHYLPECKPQTGKRVAVIGAGPAGLSAAWYLTIAGNEVTVYDRHRAPGGMLRYGIPAYRMPRETLDREINIIRALGVKLVFETAFGTDITADSLKKDGFDAIFLAVGSQVGQPLGCNGEGVCFNVRRGVDFLGSVTEGKAPDFAGKDIVVVGGGNTAMDAARTSLRLGAKSVRLVYRRSLAEMPADKLEIEEAELEGVEYCMLTNPKEVGMRDGKTILTLIRMELGAPDASGRRSPKEVPGSEYELPVDYVIAAIGQTQDLSFINESMPLSVERNRLIADPNTGATNIPGIFAAGDAVTGPKTAIMAIAGGRAAARSIDQYLNGAEIAAPVEEYNHTKGKHYTELDPAEFAEVERAAKSVMPMLSPKEREHSFQEVELGFSREAAMAEAKRCLSCGCKDVDECRLRAYSTQYKADQYHFAGEMTRHPIDESHPYLVRDRNKCIMCGRCVRICLEVQGQGALGFISRGYTTTVEPSFCSPFGEEPQCVRCGQCVSSCPVGALTEKVPLTQPGPYHDKVTDTICTYCAAGCTVELRTNGDTLIRTTSDTEKGINRGNLCEKGRFHNTFLNDKERLTRPKVRRNGVLADATLEEALNAIAAGIESVKGDGFAVFLSGRSTSENALALASIAAGRGSESVLSFGTDVTAASFFRLYPELQVSGYDEILAKDLIVGLGCDIFDTSSSVPMTAIRRAVRENASYRKETAVTAELSTAVEAAKAPLLVLGLSPDAALLKDAVALCRKTGAKLFVDAGKANTRGIGAYLNLKRCAEGPAARSVRAAVLFGEDPVGCGFAKAGELLRDADFSVVCDLYLTETAALADVVLPMSASAEEAGSFVNVFGNEQKLTPALNGKFTSRDLLSALAFRLGSKKAASFPCDEILAAKKAVSMNADILEEKLPK